MKLGQAYCLDKCRDTRREKEPGSHNKLLAADSAPTPVAHAFSSCVQSTSQTGGIKQSMWTQGATQRSGDAAYVCREHRKPVEVVKWIISGKAAEAAQPVVPLCNMVESVRGAPPVPKNAVDKQSTTRHG